MFEVRGKRAYTGVIHEPCIGASLAAVGARTPHPDKNLGLAEMQFPAVSSGLHIALFQVDIQCESKKSPLRFSEIFPQTVGNF